MSLLTESHREGSSCIEWPKQITDLIASEVGELLEIVARDAAIELTAPDGMTIRPLSPYRFDQRGSRSVLLLGYLVAEQHLEAVVRIKFGYGQLGSEVGVLVGATDRDGTLAAADLAPVAIGWQYADDRANDAQPRDRSVDRRVAAFFAARARQEAVKLNRLGDYSEAVLELCEVAAKIRGYAGSHPELNALVVALVAEEGRWAAPSPETLRKVAFASANYHSGAEGRKDARIAEAPRPALSPSRWRVSLVQHVHHPGAATLIRAVRRAVRA